MSSIEKVHGRRRCRIVDWAHSAHTYTCVGWEEGWGTVHPTNHAWLRPSSPDFGVMTLLSYCPDPIRPSGTDFGVKQWHQHGLNCVCVYIYVYTNSNWVVGKKEALEEWRKEKNMKNILVDTLNSKAAKRNIIDQIENKPEYWNRIKASIIIWLN